MVDIVKPDIESITSDFHTFSKAQADYQGSEEQQLDEYTKAHEEYVAPLAEEELEKQNANPNDDSLIQNILEILPDVAIGAVKSVGEIVEAAGGPENIFNLNKPDDTFSAIVQTFGQFGIPYLGSVKAVSYATKAANILKKSPKLKVAADSMIAGMPVDAFAFDPEEGNMFNFAISALGVSEDGRAGAAIKEYLAVQTDDPEALARAKNALTGVIGTVLFDRFIRLMGGTIKAGTKAVKNITKGDTDFVKTDPSVGDTVFGKQKETTPKPKVAVKEITNDEDAAKELSDTLSEDFVENYVNPMRDLPQEELAYVSSKLDSVDAAIYKEANKDVEDFAATYNKASDEEKSKYVQVFTDVIEGKTLSDIDLDLLNPFNITKLNSPQERLSVISQLGEIMKDKLPRNVSKASKQARRQFLDEEINRITKYWGVDPEAFVKHLRTVTGSVDNAIAYIQSSKLITDIQVQKGLKLGRAFLKSKDPKDYEAFTAAAVNSVETARGASGLGTAFGRGLAEFKHIADMGDLASQADLMKAKMMNDVITSTPELGKKRASVMVKLDEIAEFEKKENPERFKKQKPLTDEQKADKNIKRLEKYLKDLQTGKDKTSKRTRTPREQEILDQIKAFKAEKKLTEIFSAEQMQTRARFKSTLMSTKAKTRDVLSEIYINGLLSSFKTSIINLAGNTSAIMSSIIERWYAAATNVSADGVTLGEAAQLTWSYVATLPDFFRQMYYAMKHGPSDGAMKLDMVKPHDRAITPELFNAQGNVAKAIDYFGKAVNLPGRALLSADEAFKMLNYRAELDALAYRKAKSKVGAIGDKRILAETMGDIKKNMLDHPDLMEQAKGFSEINTFTNKLPEVDRIDFNTGEITQVGGMSRTFKKLIDRDPTGLMRVFIPFFQTPVNLLSHAGQRTPLIRRMSDSLMADLKSQNPATRQLAEAKIATGNMMWMTAFGLAMTGNFTGAPPADIDLRRRQEEAMGGAFWYSYMTDDGWVNYNRLDPLGIVLSGATTIATLAKSLITLTEQGAKGGYDQEIFDAYQATFADAAIGLTRMVTDRHYLQGFGNMIDLVTGDQRGLSRALGNLATAVDPTASFYSSFRRGIDRGINPVRETKIKQEELEASDPITAGYQAIVQELDSIFSTSLSLIPGVGSERPASINLVGEKRFYPGTSTSDDLHVEPLEVISNTFNTMFNPLAGGTRSKSAVMNKLALLGSTLQGPELVSSISGVKLSQEEHQFFAQTWTELNKKLEKRAGSKAFDRMAEGAQLEELEMNIAINKQIAQIQTESKFPRIANASMTNELDDLMNMSTETIPKTGAANLFNLGQGQP
jgi:O6-methylguanine-DNA--protein-cysteine methyltransferase